jgi:hypothetical protein
VGEIVFRVHTATGFVRLIAPFAATIEPTRKEPVPHDVRRIPGVAGVGSLEGRVGAILAQRFLEKVVVAYLNPVVVRVNGVCVLGNL